MEKSPITSAAPEGNKSVYRSAIFTGLMLLLTSAIHFLNINEPLLAVKTGDISLSHAPFATGMWIFGGMGMALAGIWLLFLARDLKRLYLRAWWQAILIGISLAASGVGSWEQNPTTFAFLIFPLYAFIILWPCLLHVRKFRNK